MRSLAICLLLLGMHSADAAVTIATATDDASIDAAARKANADVMRRALADVVAPVRGPARQIDASIIAWHVETVGTQIEVTASLQFAICDAHGQLVSIVSGRATITAPRRSAQLPDLRKQAVETAVKTSKLRAALQPAV